MLFLQCLILLVLLGQLYADKLDYHSFSAPFEEVDNGGNRFLNDIFLLFLLFISSAYTIESLVKTGEPEVLLM